MSSRHRIRLANVSCTRGRTLTRNNSSQHHDTEATTLVLEDADDLCVSACLLVKCVVDRLVDPELAVPVTLKSKVSPYGSEAAASVVLDDAAPAVHANGSQGSAVARRIREFESLQASDSKPATPSAPPRFADYYEAAFVANGFGKSVEGAWTTATVSLLASGLERNLYAALCCFVLQWHCALAPRAPLITHGVVHNPR